MLDSALAHLAFAARAFTPLFVGLALNGVAMRFGWLSSLAVPIDGGRRWRGRPLFGPHKTHRGWILVAVGSALGYAAQAALGLARPDRLNELSPLASGAVGLAVGVAAMASELPNSFVKRRLGIAAGAAGRGWLAAAFYLADQADLLVGAWLVLFVWVHPTPARVAWSVVFVVIAHQLISLAGSRLGMRASAR